MTDLLPALRFQARLTRDVVRMNVEGVTHEESLVQPRPAGNCLNWVLGHLTAIYNGTMPLFGASPVRPEATLARYARGSSPILSPHDALPLAELTSAWEEACARVDAALADFPADRLSAPLPTSPTGDPDATVGSVMTTVIFHQAYHAGQLGVLRRIVGKPGAVR